MPRLMRLILLVAVLVFATVSITALRRAPQPPRAPATGFDATINQQAQRMLEEGKIFR